MAAVLRNKILKRHTGTRLDPLKLIGLAFVLQSASCVPDSASQSVLSAGSVSVSPVQAAAAAAIPEMLPMPVLPFAGTTPPAAAIAGNAALPFSSAPNPAAEAFALRTRALTDQLRSLECLASAIYYEASSQSEDGQRAVAQVVLNRVRHPAYPNTVCGVVYQGPMRAGGGCQFTFTCDGSLARRPSMGGWIRARRFAAEALAGKVYAPVGNSTHYHANYVFPHWAPKLLKTAVIGAHIFYRLGGAWGQPGVFRQAHAGYEPAPRPYIPPVRTAASVKLAGYLPSMPQSETAAPPPAPEPDDNLPRVEYKGDGLPQSTVRPEYANSGVPLSELGR
jgi:spore germination cell wall hydrolase CwlJ-like protein